MVSELVPLPAWVAMSSSAAGLSVALAWQYNKYMLPKSSRLTRLQIESVIRTGKSQISPLASLKFLPNHVGHLRLGAAISTKSVKRATRRNQLRRWIYDSPTADLHKLNLDVIIFPKSQMVNLEHAAITTTVHSLLSGLL